MPHAHDDENEKHALDDEHDKRWLLLSQLFLGKRTRGPWTAASP